MSEITVKGLMEMVGSGACRAESVDRYGIFIRMEQADLMYDTNKDELTFLGRAASEVSFNVGNAIKYIGVGTDGTILIEFNPEASVIEIRKAEVQA